MKKLLGLCVLVGSMSAFGAEPKYAVGDCFKLDHADVKVVFLEIIQPDYLIEFTEQGKSKNDAIANTFFNEFRPYYSIRSKRSGN